MTANYFVIAHARTRRHVVLLLPTLLRDREQPYLVVCGYFVAVVSMIYFLRLYPHSIYMAKVSRGPRLLEQVKKMERLAMCAQQSLRLHPSIM